MAVDTQAQTYLTRHRRVWQHKPVLRRIYKEEFFARLLSFRTPNGISVELGGGPGFLRDLCPGLISTDLVWCPWLDAVADAQFLPFRTASVTNILGLDMLHHLAAPMLLLKEAERTLVPGGRLILIEPWVTPLSRFIYRYLHKEDCDLSAQPWSDDWVRQGTSKRAFDGNQAIPYLLFESGNASKTLEAVPGLKMVLLEPFCLFAYLLSLGFKPFNLLPEFLYPAVSKFERTTAPLWRRVAALRVLIVVEKSGKLPDSPTSGRTHGS